VLPHRRWLRAGCCRSDGDFASASALVDDLIRGSSATRGSVVVEVARSGADLVRRGRLQSGGSQLLLSGHNGDVVAGGGRSALV